ncbi:MAG: AAA family ATPase [Cocleimonas sp.]
MLIKSLNAINFRKFTKLIINDIPESGVITVAGSNESGKTSIGEAICFALFGRTFFQDEKSLFKLVCWGTDLAEVTLTFKTGQGEIYSLWRSVNRKGEIDVRLSQFEENTDIKEDESALTDKETVDDAVSKLLGFDFDAFSNSFYLAQRELTSPDPQSYSIKQMAGIAAYSKITDDLELSNQRNNETIGELQPQVDSNREKLDEINLDETWLPELIDAEETLGSEQKGREQLLGKLNDDDQLYVNNFTSFNSARKSSGLFGVLGKLSFISTIVLGLMWVVNTFYPEVLIEFLLNNFSDSILSSFSIFAEKWLLPAVIVSIVIALLSWVLRKKAKTKMVSLNEEVKDFSGLLDTGHNYVTTLAESLLPERVVQLLHQRDTEPSTLQVLPPREQFNNLTRLISDSLDYQADPEEMSAATSRLTEALKKQDGEVVDLSSKILDDISVEKVRADKAGNLRATLHNLSKAVDKCNYNIDTQTIAIGIMQRAASDSIDKFNQKISDVSAKTLPSFTENRYSELKIAEDFTVQIYSDEKNDYMDFDEISSGTQRQVMLSLRIAMSEQLSINSGNEEQFIFLDEPFAFFDQSRTRSTLENLPKVSDVINQIWISAQEFPDYTKVAKQIECPSDQSELIV